mgnify:CR=1 FL=1
MFPIELWCAQLTKLYNHQTGVWPHPSQHSHSCATVNIFVFLIILDPICRNKFIYTNCMTRLGNTWPSWVESGAYSWTSFISTECVIWLSSHSQCYNSLLLQIINLSSVSRILERNNPQVYEYGFPATLAPSLESICSISRTVASWIQRTRDQVVVFHCKGGIDRLACVLAAYVNYSSIYDG